MNWVFDGHLDLASNALVYERDQVRPVAALRAREAAGVRDDRGLCSCSLHELRRGGVRLCVATVLARAKPWIDAGRAIGRGGDWPSQDMAHAVVSGQMAYYELLERRGQIALIRNRADLAAHLDLWRVSPDDAVVGLIVTMEGADAITDPDELALWHGRGLRTLMLAHFGKSHYAHGTPSTDPSKAHDVDGPLGDRCGALFDRMTGLGMPLDLSHLSDRSFAEAVERFSGAVYASHSSCRAIVSGGGDVHPMRMLDDGQVRTVVRRGGVVGLPMFNAFVKQGDRPDSDPDAVSFGDVAEHVDHVCQLAGGAGHVAIGSDCDGGFGAEHMPRELDTVADLARLGDALTARGYDDGDVAAVLHGNWTRFFMEHLPDA